MQEFIAFYDILGFKEFTLNNEPNIVKRGIEAIFRESQYAICKGNKIEDPLRPGVLIPDFDFAEVNCMHISDSIVFWTTGGLTENNFRNIVEACYTFNWRTQQTTIPVRGCLVTGEMEFKPFKIENRERVEFYNSSMFGLGITKAYTLAENQDWAGSYIDKSAINAIANSEQIISSLIYAKKIVFYQVPLKGGKYSYELAFRSMGTLNDVGFYNSAKTIEGHFAMPSNGKPLDESVQRKLVNTIKFLDYFRIETQPEETKDGNEL